jgi:hypothetical protein
LYRVGQSPEGNVNPRKLLPIAIVTLVVTAGGGCASQDTSSTDRSTRAASAVDACRGHGGVSAFDDDAVICEDETFQEERGAKAVEACEGHRGVSAFDDDIVICRDQTFHRAEGG